MPPRAFVAVVVIGWLATMGWLIADYWRLGRQAERPPFAIDPADEVAPQNASWIVYRDGKPIGRAETRLAPRKDGRFELTTHIWDIDLAVNGLQANIPSLSATRIVSREGDLNTASARVGLIVKSTGHKAGVDSSVRREVIDHVLQGKCDLDINGNKSSLPLEPIPIGPTGAFAPLQPLHKYPPLRPGQSWQVLTVDPISEALSIALGQAAGKRADVALGELPPPTVLVARVQSETEAITHRDRTYTCRVIVVGAERVVARVWVDVHDGRVIRQEGSLLGQTMCLQRD